MRLISLYIIISYFMTACTISFQNIGTNSEDSQVEKTTESDQKPVNDVKPNVDISLPILP